MTATVGGSTHSQRLPLTAVATWFVVCALFAPAVDLGMFMASVENWLRGGSLYDPSIEANINLPHTTLLFLPFVWLPSRVAFVSWQLCQVACAIRVLWIVRERIPAWGWVLAAVAQPSVSALLLGQIAWFIAWLVVEAYEAERRGRIVAGGLWLAAAAALKPFLGLPLLGYVYRRRPTILYVAGLMTAVGVLGLAVFGIDEYRAWWVLSQLRASAPNRGNLSIAGTAWNWNVPEWAWIGQLVVLIASAAAQIRGAHWTALLPASLLLSPIAWGYYLWICAPLLQRRRLIAVACRPLAREG